MMAEEPPLWSSYGVSNGSTPINMIFPGPGVDLARVLGIEVQDGNSIRYELQLLGPLASNARTPGLSSRKLSGFTYIPWSAGATFSFVDCANHGCYRQTLRSPAESHLTTRAMHTCLQSGR